MIGSKIKRLREEKGITQRQLANAINYSNSYIGDLESGRTNPSIKTLEVIANYFKVEVTYFLEGECCFEKLQRGVEDFCYSNKENCQACPLRMGNKIYK